MGAATTIYVIDTSALIAAWNETYSPKAFPGFWEHFDDLIEAKRLIAPREVLEELGKVDDDPHEWLKERNHILHDLDAPLMTKTTEVLTRFPSLTSAGGKRGRADPFVVALGSIRGATVVTKERSTPTKPRIPDACQGFGVPCITLMQMILAEEWQFDRR